MNEALPPPPDVVVVGAFTIHLRPGLNRMWFAQIVDTAWCARAVKKPEDMPGQRRRRPKAPVLTSREPWRAFHRRPRKTPLPNRLWRRELYVRVNRGISMQLFDALIEADANDLDWCADPTDLERALARRLVELEPSECGSMSIDEKLARFKLAREFERVLQH